MKSLAQLPDPALLANLSTLVATERHCIADVIEHLVEVDRRRLFLDEACRSLSQYCIERLSYSEDEACKRVRVARLVRRFPCVLDELRAGSLHLTGLFLLSRYLTDENYESLMARARGASKRRIERLIACEFPKPDVPERVDRIPEQFSLEALAGDEANTSARIASVETPPMAPDALDTCPGPASANPASGAFGAAACATAHADHVGRARGMGGMGGAGGTARRTVAARRKAATPFASRAAGRGATSLGARWRAVYFRGRAGTALHGAALFDVGASPSVRSGWCRHDRQHLPAVWGAQCARRTRGVWGTARCARA